LEAKEAVGFAVLGYTTFIGWENNVPSVTGAKKSTILGKIIPGSASSWRKLIAK